MNDRPREPSSEGLSEDEREGMRERQRLRAPVVYHIVQTEGVEEMQRPISSLWWSGVAAGLGISVSVFAEGLLRMHLPDAPWRPLVENLGYCIGFLIVIMGRLQLFTENTITVVLPLIADYSHKALYCTARLWTVVLLANLFGTLIVAALATFAEIGPSAQLDAAMEAARHMLEKTPLQAFLHAVPAGFLIAVLVWMLPSARGAEFFVIIVVTYVIALGEFAHVVAGSTEAFLVLLHGEIGLWECVGGFLLPALAGNIVGGTVLFSLLAYGQVREELDELRE